MVVLNRIYTRTGDAGQTGLASGARVSKSDARVEAYGCVDELNAVIGVARAHHVSPADAAALVREADAAMYRAKSRRTGVEATTV